MNTHSLAAYWYLLRTFRNGPDLIRTARNGGLLANGPTIDEAIFWDGARLCHPPGRGGFIGTLLEVLLDNVYRLGSFYKPEPGDLVLDLGAHVGIYTFKLLRNYPCRVMALEPSAENVACLRKNLAHFGEQRVQIYNMAVGGASGRVRVETPKSTNRSHDARVVPGSDGDGDAVDIIPLSAVLELAQADQVALLKMDIEGGEYDVFNTLDEAMLPRIERIAMEYHDNLREGTLDMLKNKLRRTHDLTITGEGDGRGYGMLFAQLKEPHS